MVKLIKQEELASIDCEAAVLQGMTAALVVRLEQMCALREAALDWSDPEGVHKMRVASRRLRGALRDFEPYLGKRRISSPLQQIKEIARALGHVRDHDVAIMTLERTATKAPQAVAAGIPRLVQIRDADRQEARVKLTAILASELLSELNTRLKTTLAGGHLKKTRVNPSPGQSLTAASVITYREAARSIILARLDDLESLSKHLYEPLKVKPLHNLRIGAKHLRYALQLFEPCWGTALAAFAKKVAGLQSSLGKLHDCDVWIKELGGLISGDVCELDGDRATLIWLLCNFVKLRGKHLSEALMQWQDWEAKDFSKRLRETIGAHSLVSKD